MKILKSLDIWIITSLTGIILYAAFNIFGIYHQNILQYFAFIITGIAAFAFFYKAGLQLFRDNYIALFAVFLFLFIATLLFGENIRGSKRWIDILVFNFQTSEFYKPFFTIIIASLLSTQNRFTHRRLLITFFIVGISFFFIFIQPDLSTAVMFLSVFSIMFYFSGVPSKTVLKCITVIFLAIPFVWFILKPYQQGRIIGFMNPDIDPQGLSYNLHQSIITIGSGNILGKGLGMSTQSRYKFLPEYHTDFAFASLVEQFGFVGGAIVIILFGVILYRLFNKAASKHNDSFSYLFIIGIISFIGIPIFVNIGMNMGLLPVTGIALPFISYGGSSIVSTMIMLALALSI
ncbi:hypothetical protein A2957_02540 [Candidatus Roizmanbacteria bacterium RIFCSPLOWO2_01_FULL_38_11]|uniref:Rod shape-determining protein RodA n=1 Tax=Candidatus Roizmanbacteria bacterium RIFCSPLOWO2_01_FULL_38_11 TaxID=1802060 RepID=A0A1F7INA6_9BACT|nr:MAG: hypothetical protein A2957_02540 [Candidatus Roizmanbacteria bacterium RIFCSPLOWO2_01_FULL_38_11]